MTKNDYLELPIVRSFIQWFASENAQNLNHDYYYIAKKKSVYFKKLPEALENYEWRGDFKQNSEKLDYIQTKLRLALTTKNLIEFEKAGQELMKWGGTVNGNGKWLEKLKNEDAEVTYQMIVDTLKIIYSDLDDIQSLKNISHLRFNSGLTKIFALIADNFVIYDSRVAAAMAWYVLRFVEFKKLAEVPSELKFVCMKAKGGKQSRNPDSSKNGFPFTSYSQPEVHLHWNIRVNWILKDVLDQMESSIFHNQLNTSPLRSLEAALFMWGYDVNTNSNMS